MWQLLINGPGYFDTLYLLPEGVTQVGRADENDVVLSGDLVSRRHCRFIVERERVRFEELGSRNGTKLNEMLITGSVELKVGDVVGVGENALTLKDVALSGREKTEQGPSAPEPSSAVTAEIDVLLARDLKDSGFLRALESMPVSTLSAPPVKTGSRTESDEREPALATQSLLLLYRVSEALVRASTPREFLEQTLELLLERVAGSAAAVLLPDGRGGFAPAIVRGARSTISQTVVQTAVMKGQAIAVADVHHDQRFQDRQSVASAGVRQVLCIPLGVKAPYAGLLYVNRDAVTGAPLEAQLDLCTAVSQLMLVGVERLEPSTGALPHLLRRVFPAATVASMQGALAGGASPTFLNEVTATVLIAELLPPPERTLAQRSTQLAHWHRVACSLVQSFGGAVDATVSGLVRASFGLPTPQGDDGIRAVRAALAIRAEWSHAVAEAWPVRFALSTGRVVGGVVGTSERFDSVLEGEPVDIAEQLLSQGLPGQVLITSKTVAHTDARFEVNPLGERGAGRFKVPAFEVLEEDLDLVTQSGVR